MKAELIVAAKEARENAYAPYSDYAVGAAVEALNGVIYSGCNVESCVYGISVCAERNAIAAMILAGERKVCACAVATENGAPPCGACLQTLTEFADDPNGCVVYSVSANDEVEEYKLSELLPRAFDL